MNSEDPYPDLTQWASRFFENGRTISRGDFGRVCEEFIFHLLLPSFRDRYVRNRVCNREPDRTWWAGLAALAEFWAAKVVSGIGPIKLPQRIGFLDWGLLTHAELCRIVGLPAESNDDTSFGFPPSWTLNRGFIAAWERALREPADNRLQGMLILALEWDTCWIPMRYFSDRAAVAYLNQFALKHAPQLVTLKNYQEHWRGSRGLKLNRDRTATVVDLPHDSDECLFRVDARLSEQLGLKVREFAIGPKGGKPQLRFKVDC